MNLLYLYSRTEFVARYLNKKQLVFHFYYGSCLLQVFGLKQKRFGLSRFFWPLGPAARIANCLLILTPVLVFCFSFAFFDEGSLGSAGKGFSRAAYCLGFTGSGYGFGFALFHE